MPSYAMVAITPEGETYADDAAYYIASSKAPVAWSEPKCLAEDEAYEVTFESDAELARDMRDRLAEAFQEWPLDLCLVPTAHRRKRLLIADMDSTIIQQECIDEMADVLGLKPRISAITERAMRGELPFEDALRERLALLAGIGEAQLREVFEKRVTLMPGAKTLVATMTANGARTALVSGGFTFFTSRVAKAVGFAENHANTLEVVDGKLTGRVVGPILGREAKLANLERLRGALGLASAETLAVGDGANDLDMIRAAGLGVAYRAKPIVAKEAHASITHGDLTALLYLQGYTKEEFVGV